ncbi:TPA: hemolysin activation protein, partial [Escherichia coli]|nr:hemolysin activation protein [Escherichia coli]
MRFRRCSSLDTLEKVFDSLRDKLSGKELDAM